jgi:hypothetical protein
MTTNSADEGNMRQTNRPRYSLVSLFIVIFILIFISVNVLPSLLRSGTQSYDFNGLKFKIIGRHTNTYITNGLSNIVTITSGDSQYIIDYSNMTIETSREKMHIKKGEYLIDEGRCYELLRMVQ